MNSFLFFRRIRGPVYLLTFGVTALLWEWHVLDWSQSWPLYLIVAGALRLAEGAAIASAPAAYAGGLPQQPGYAPEAYPQQAYAPGTGLVPTAPATVTAYPVPSSADVRLSDTRSSDTREES